MPIYDINCPDCGVVRDVFYRFRTISKHKDDGEDLLCRECKSSVTLRPSAPGITGFIETNPVHIKQIGRTFHTTKEMRDYERQNPGQFFTTKDDKSFRKQKKKAREKVEALAKRKGHRDFESWQNSSEMKQKRGGRGYRPKDK